MLRFSALILLYCKMTIVEYIQESINSMPSIKQKYSGIQTLVELSDAKINCFWTGCVIEKYQQLNYFNWIFNYFLSLRPYGCRDFEIGSRQHVFFYFVAVSVSMDCFCALPY